MPAAKASDWSLTNVATWLRIDLLDKRYGEERHVIMRHVTNDKNRPLSEPTVLILVSLAQEPRHGYGLLSAVEKLSDGRVCLSTGTLYGAIHRLLEDEWIERFEQEDTSRDKQAYRLTALGRMQLLAEVARLRQLTLRSPIEGRSQPPERER